MKVIIAEKIREERKKQRYKLKDLATASKSSLSAVKSWEDGKSMPNGAALLLLMDFLGLEKKDFFLN